MMLYESFLINFIYKEYVIQEVILKGARNLSMIR
jgi:hypothetical protein